MGNRKEEFERIFGKLAVSSAKLNLMPGQYTLKVDLKDGMLMGAIVNIDGTIYDSNASGDGLGPRIAQKAKAANLTFVKPVDAGLFK